MLKKVFIVILFIFFNLNLFSSEVKNYNFGFKTSSMLTTNLKDAKIALELWINSLTKSFNIRINLKYYTNNTSILNDYLVSNSLDIATIDLISYYNNLENINKNSSLIWSLSASDDEFFRYVLITNKSSEINTVNDIKNKNVIFKENDITAKIWLDKFTYDLFSQPYKNILSEEFFEIKHSRLVLKVFFGELDLAVVPENVIDDMEKLNPQIKKNIKIVAFSKKIFVPFVGFIKKGVESNLLDKFKMTSQNYEKSLRGGEIRSLVKFKKVILLEEDFIKGFDSFYKEYLKKKEI